MDRRILGLLPILLVAAATAQPQRIVLPTPNWPSDLADAFSHYYRGDYLETQQICRIVAERAHTPTLRREAEALSTMATMRLPGRANQITGRTLLAQLSKNQPDLLERPECNLAYAFALSGLHETATAIFHFERAIDGFQKLGRPDRIAEACVAEAETWVHLGEWDQLAALLGIKPPVSRAEADGIRTERITALRDRVAGFEGEQAACARIELVLAQLLMGIDEQRERGVAMLEELSAREPLTRTIAEARLELASVYESARRWSEAAALYRAIETAPFRDIADVATERAKKIIRADVAIEVPSRVTPGEPLRPRLLVRNVDSAELEVRRLDLLSFLESHQGRFSESSLPTTGAVVAVTQFDTRAETPHDWWDSAGETERAGIELPRGASVIIARAVDERGRSVETKRLVICGELQAGVFLGPRRGLVWAVRGEGPAVGDAGDNDAVSMARFWMHGSFVPVRIGLSEGVGAFELPADAHLLRDKRWVCLVQVGDEVALCGGELPPASASETAAPAVALTSNSHRLSAGQTLRLSGVLFPPVRDASVFREWKTLEVRLLDSFEKVHAEAEAVVSPAGTFEAALAIGEEQAGEHLRAEVRLNNQVLEQVFRSFNVEVQPLDASTLQLDCVLPSWQRPESSGLIGTFEAWYPWNSPLSDKSVEMEILDVHLPVPGTFDALQYYLPIDRRDRTDASGATAFVHNLKRTKERPGPLAVGVWGTVFGWDKRPASGNGHALIASDPAHLWIDYAPRPPHVGEPLIVSVGWFDALGQFAGQTPALSVLRGTQEVRRLRLAPVVGGLQSEPWRPTAPGVFEIVATVRAGDGETLTARRIFEVAADDHLSGDPGEPILCEARCVAGSNGRELVVRLSGQSENPLLVLLDAGEPVAARALPALLGSAEIRLEATASGAAQQRVLVVASGDAGPRMVGSWEVSDDGRALVTVEPAATGGALESGGVLPVRLRCTRGDEPARYAAALLRLVQIDASAGIQWRPGGGRMDAPFLPGGIAAFSEFDANGGGAASVDYDPAIPETHLIDPDLARAMFDGISLWTQSLFTPTGNAEIEVPLPGQPGMYELKAAVLFQDGSLATATMPLDMRERLHLAADVPNQMWLGDRCVAGLRVTNGGRDREYVRLSVELGGGLNLEQLRVVGSETRLERADEEGGIAFTIEPHQTVRLCATIEAANIGEWEVEYQVKSRSHVARTRSGYRVRECQPKLDATDSIAVRRSLFLLEESPEDPEESRLGTTASDRDELKWVRIELGPDEPIPPGSLVLVREELVAAQSLQRVLWRQNLPANCLTHADEWKELPTVGTRGVLRTDELSYSSVAFKPGLQIAHEYVVVAVRPGACYFPAPAVSIDGVPIAVEHDPEDVRVVVAGSD